MRLQENLCCTFGGHWLSHPGLIPTITARVAELKGADGLGASIPINRHQSSIRQSTDSHGRSGMSLLHMQALSCSERLPCCARMLAASTGFDAKRAATREPHGFGVGIMGKLNYESLICGLLVSPDFNHSIHRRRRQIIRVAVFRQHRQLVPVISP